MAAVTPAPLVMRNATFTVGSDEYAAAISSVSFTPSSSVITFKGLQPSAVFSAGTSATWTCELTFVQDWDTTGSLSLYLFDNEGEEVDVVFEPVDGGASISATLIITPGAIGGAVDTYATATVSLGVKGKPVITPGV